MADRGEVYDVAVLGAGIQGSATAWYLAKHRRQRVILIEQFKANHSRGSSHGPSRIIRYMYPESFYVSMMTRAYPLWQEVIRDSGNQLIWTTGGLTVYRDDFAKLHEMKESMVKHKLPHDLLTSAELERKYPGLKYQSGWTAIYDPDSGIVDAEASRHTFQSECVKHGGVLRTNCKVERVRPGDVIHLTSHTGEVIRCRKLIITAGAWAKNLMSEIGIVLPLQVVRINVCYWRPNNPHIYNRTDGFPIYGHDDGKHLFYALPTHEYPGLVKVCAHHGQSIESPDERDTRISREGGRAADVDEVIAFIRQHMPGLETEPAIVESCMYTCTPDSHPVIDRHPVWKNIAFGCGFSGHGFKLAPVVGEILSQLILGETGSHDLTPFRVNRFDRPNHSKL